MISDYRDDNYANINEIKYIFGDIDDYYTPVCFLMVVIKGFILEVINYVTCL